jgi:dethiobiotin synthetase
MTPHATRRVVDLADAASVKWSWACRQLWDGGTVPRCALQTEPSPPRLGDVALVQVEGLGHHRHVETVRERRLRLYRGDRLIGLFGNRYATDVYEGRLNGLENIHLLAGSGVIGTVVSRNRNVRRPTRLSFLGYLVDSAGLRINLLERRVVPLLNVPSNADVIAVLGTGMNTGKTTVTRTILRALVRHGVAAAGCKLTGTASPRDLREMRATGVPFVTDFSDYGFPSTSGASLTDLLRLFENMLDACNRTPARLVIVEVADGFLQRETEMLLGSDEFRRRVRGVVLAGACSGSALCAVAAIQRAGFEVWAVSGLITNSPLYMQEFTNHSPIPVLSSRCEDDWAGLVTRRLATLAEPRYGYEETAWSAG